ncbi:adaptin ear-binding coat-associated protein 1-like [Babylonia areolata]|uniref:adaptin ear-binding coat-associated protein 1-like n=1 Tax=Babylonia areolata TaxID=304850 RepID=UPI003FD2080E
MADSGYESVLCVKNEVFVYRIPPRPSNRGYRASEWKLDAPDWTGRLRVVAVNKELFIKLEDKSTGELFAQCPVDMYPGIAVEAVMDSSRYFVLQIKDPSGRSAFIGIGFADRSDSFDLNVALQDHFKWIKQEQEAEKAATELTSGPKLDLGFKAGQTITLNLGNKKGDAGGARSKPKPRAMGGMLPPPPGGSGGIKLPPPSTGGGSGVAGSGSAPPPGMQSGVGGGGGGASASSASSISSSVDLLLDLAPSPSQSSAPAPMAPPPPAQPPTGDLWGDFAGANNSSAAPASSASSNASNWVQF